MVLKKSSRQWFHSGLNNYTSALDLPFTLPTSLYGCMLVIWQLRPALQKKFPLHKQNPNDYVGFLAWCVLHGMREYTILKELSSWQEELNQPALLPKLLLDKWGETFTVGMMLLGIARCNYSATPLFASPIVRHQTARWYWRDGRIALGFHDVPLWQKNALFLQFGSYKLFVRTLVHQKSKNWWSHRKALLYHNKHLCTQVLNEPPPLEPFKSYFLKINPLAKTIAYAVPRLWKKITLLRNRLRLLIPHQAQGSVMMKRIGLRRETCPPQTTLLPFGVNLYGYAKGELGIGEDVRMLAHAFLTINVPVCMINVAPGANVSQQDESMAHCLREKPVYFFNVFCMTGIEYTRFLCEQGTHALRGRYTIGLWPWELPTWPKAWHHAYNGVHEIWGISSYTSNAYQAAPVPVKTMPLPVMIPEIATRDRASFNLPKTAYLFIFSFDFNSTLARKNPEAVIKAFERMFVSEGRADVGLVLKVSHSKNNHKTWQTLKNRINGDERIHLIEGALRKSDVLALYQACQCFISLHRAEGFGRGIAEAMLLGLEIITTGFSGNMDFCNQDNIHLVHYQKCNLAKNDYFFGDGQYWAEPDVEHAGALMRQVYEEKRKTKPTYNVEKFDARVCGRAYEQRLCEIYNRLSSSDQWLYADMEFTK